MNDQFTTNSGNQVSISMEDFPDSIVVRDHNNNQIGELSFVEKEGPMGEVYYRLTHAFLDKLDGYVGQGIGTECIRRHNQFSEMLVEVGTDDGLGQRADGSHFVGNGAGFAASLIQKGLAFRDQRGD